MNVQQIAGSAHPFLGPVRLITNADVTFDYRGWNDRTIREALRVAGWKGGRVAYLSTYNAHYTRTETLIAILRRSGVAVDVHVIESRALRLLSMLPGLRRRYDAFILGFRGHHLLPFVRSFLKGRPLVFDLFTPLSDTCEDRWGMRPQSPIGRFLRRIDSVLCQLSDAVLVDTQTNAAHVREAFRARNVFPVYVECNENMFCKRDATHAGIASLTPQGDASKIILWYGTCQPLHGVDRILRWAKSLETDPSLRFRLIGPVRARYDDFLRALAPRTVECLEHVPYEELPREIARASLCLSGPFGESAKARRVITGKTYQMLACGKPVLIADTPATKELFT